MAKGMNDRAEVIQPAIFELVELGRGVGGTKISASDRATTRENLLKALNDAREHSRRVSTPTP